MKKLLLKTIFVFSFFVFCNVAYAQKNIRFTEEESIPVNETFLKENMKLSKLILAPGEYEINFDKNPNGRIEFKIAEVSPTEVIGTQPFKVGIRIAKRECSRYKAPCTGCVGFRCGFITIQLFSVSNLEDPRIAGATLTLDTKKGLLWLDFEKGVDWKKMSE
jgi:hypothetical protein